MSVTAGNTITRELLDSGPPEPDRSEIVTRRVGPVTYLRLPIPDWAAVNLRYWADILIRSAEALESGEPAPEVEVAAGSHNWVRSIVGRAACANFPEDDDRTEYAVLTFVYPRQNTS